MSSPKESVLAFVQAINDEKFDEARQLAAGSMTFVGVLGSRDGADTYVEDMKKMKLKYDIQKAIADGDDVCLFYDGQNDIRMRLVPRYRRQDRFTQGYFRSTPGAGRQQISC